MNQPNFEEIISPENLFNAWREFVKGKKHKKDVMEFSVRLSENIFNLHTDLRNKSYTHGGYEAFKIRDPKPRDIHKASVRDRLLHHAIYRFLYPYFDGKFIHDSYSCRNYKGTHKAVERLNLYARKVSKNNTKQCWVLKCDIKKFFASIYHEILIEILRKHTADKNIIRLIQKVVESFHSGQDGKGLPLGNLTSQLLVNIYMNQFDQFVKHELKIKYYIRYADDFVFLSQSKTELENLLPILREFLENKLKLTLHPNKVFIKTFSSGIDFLGWVNFPKHKTLRTVTKRRMIKKLKMNPSEGTIQSYLGLVGHGNTFKIKQTLDFKVTLL